MAFAYLYAETSWLLLNNANVSPGGDFDDVQMNEDTMERLRSSDDMLRLRGSLCFLVAVRPRRAERLHVDDDNMRECQLMR